MDIIAGYNKIIRSIKNLGMRIIHNKENIIADDEKTIINNGAIPNNLTQHENQDRRFNIADAIKELNNSREFLGEKFGNGKVQEGWLIRKPILYIGKEIAVQINVIIRYDTNELILLMPMYDNGSEGLTGSKIESFWNSIHHFNSRTNGGYFTKYTYDETYAPVFMFHLPLSKMDYDWFRSMVNYFMDIFAAFRPRFDSLINEFELKFEKEAASKDRVIDCQNILKFMESQKRFEAVEEPQKHFLPPPISGCPSEAGGSSCDLTTDRDLYDKTLMDTLRQEGDLNERR
jgi:hypothetical protein